MPDDASAAAAVLHRVDGGAATARLTASTWWYFAITFHVFAPSVSNSTKLRMRSSRPAGVNTSRISTSSCERPSIAAGSIDFHSAKCSAGVVIVPTRALSRSRDADHLDVAVKAGIVWR